MGYTESPDWVRVDFFKESGKWYTAEAVKCTNWSAKLVADQFRQDVLYYLQGRLRGFWAVCIEPYYEHGYPMMIKLPE